MDQVVRDAVHESCSYADADALTATLGFQRAEELYLSTKKVFVVEDEEGEDLCKCDFSLAYGALILLNNATLHMKKGKRYGLCGPNGCGKSTLMKAINNGQVENFPATGGASHGVRRARHPR